MAYEPSTLALLGHDVSIAGAPACRETPGKAEVFRVIDVQWEAGICRLLVVSCANDRLRVLSADEVVLLPEDIARACLVPHRRRA